MMRRSNRSLAGHLTGHFGSTGGIDRQTYLLLPIGVITAIRYFGVTFLLPCAFAAACLAALCFSISPRPRLVIPADRTVSCECAVSIFLFGRITVFQPSDVFRFVPTAGCLFLAIIHCIWNSGEISETGDPPPLTGNSRQSGISWRITGPRCKLAPPPSYSRVNSISGCR